MTDEEIKKLIDERDSLKAERDYLRKKLDEEKRYQQWCIDHRFKGYASGQITRCVGMFMIEHCIAEDVEKVKIVIRKLANNPVIAPDVQNALDKARWYLDQYLSYRKNYYELLDTDKAYRHLQARKWIAKKKTEDQK